MSAVAAHARTGASETILLAAEDLRIDVDGAPACDGLGFRTRGEHVLILGAPRVLFEATVGLVNVVRGTFSVRGTPAAEATRRGIIAGAPQELPLPPRWSVAEYIQWSARLAGVPTLEARANAAAAIERLKLGPLAKTETAKLVPHARRATTVAAALATCAEVIALDDPLGGLAEEVAATYATVLAEALSDRAWVLFAPRIPLASPLAQGADDAIVATALRIEAQGAPAELAGAERRYVARLDGRVDDVLSELEGRGARVEVHGGHLLLDLGPGLTTSELAAICATARVAVVELVPAFRALT